jgi:G protein-coupled receptor Mth (Methuselah protein)
VILKLKFQSFPGMLISLPFLIATFLVYGIIPELRNLHGKCLMAYVFSLMIFYIGSIIAHFLRSKLYKNDIRCVMLGYSYLIGVLLCFFWLNVMCYDIWNTFYYRRGRRRSEKSKFINYCLYAVGIPLLLILIVYFIDSTEFVSKKFRPEIGEDRCLVKKSVHAIYIYYPITILLLINIVLYSITAFTIYRVQKETAIIRQGDSQTHSKMKSDRNQFKLFLRLFVLMGVTWIMEVISFYLGKDLQALFYITDFLNCIQGVIIFFMFVWKPTVKKLIFQHFSSYFPTHSAESQSTNT